MCHGNGSLAAGCRRGAKAGRHGGKESREFSGKFLGHNRASFRHSTRFFTARLVPRRSVQNDRVWGEVHWRRSVAVGRRRGDTEAKNPVSFQESFWDTIGRRSDIPRGSSLRGSLLAAPFRMTVFGERFIGGGVS